MTICITTTIVIISVIIMITMFMLLISCIIITTMTMCCLFLHSSCLGGTWYSCHVSPCLHLAERASCTASYNTIQCYIRKYIYLYIICMYVYIYIYIYMYTHICIIIFFVIIIIVINMLYYITVYCMASLTASAAQGGRSSV